MSASLVQSNHTGSNASSISFSSATTAGNLVLVAVAAYTNTSMTGVTLGGSSDNFSQVCSATQGSTHVWIWVDPDCAGGQTAIALQGSNWATDNLSVYEFSGVDAVDKYSSNSGTGTTWSSGTTATTTDAHGAWVGICDIDNSTSPPGSPWTTTADYGFSESSYQIRSSTGTATYSGTQTSGDWSAAVVALKITSGDAAVSASTVSGTSSIPLPLFHSSAFVSPGVVPGALSVPLPQLSLAPAGVTGAGSIPAPSIVAYSDSGVTASVVSGSGSMPGPMITGAGLSYSAYVGTGGSAGLEGSWSALANAEGSSSSDYASGTVV